MNLLEETLFITVNLIDRTLAAEEPQIEQLQLIGITALLIASKYEDIYPPEIEDLVRISANQYRKQDVLDMQMRMLVIVDFNLTFPTTLAFLRRYWKLCEEDSVAFQLALYLTELALVEYKMNSYSPS